MILRQRAFLKLISFFFLLILLTGCKFEPVSLSRIDNIKFGSIDFLRGTITLDMGLKINNPNNYAVTIHSMDLNVNVNGASLGNVFVEDRVKIQKDTEMVYRVNVVAKITDILNAAPKITAAIAKKQADVILKGSIKAGVGPMRKKIEIDYKQQHVAVGQK
jgi:LEA14-like dessication related protein